MYTMKRTLLVLLALVMTVAVMCGLAMAAPTDDPTQAVVAVEIGGTTTYYDALNSDVIASVATTTGGGTITLLKDHALASKLVVPAQATANPIVLDLGGFTLTNSNNHNGIVLNGNVDFTIKNGIYVQSGVGQNIQISETGGGNNDGAGNYYKATVSFDDVCVMNTNTADGACVVESKYRFADFNVTDSVLWSAHTNFRATFNMENHVWTSMNVTNSVVGGANADRIFRIAQDSAVTDTKNLDITATNSVFVSGDGSIGSGTRNKVNGAQWGPVDTTQKTLTETTTTSTPVAYTTGSTTCTAVTPFSFTAPNGLTLTSPTATQFGTAPDLGTPAAYPVTYNANGGEGAPAAQTKAHGEALTLSATVPTRIGYTFEGWATSVSGEVAYAAGASYTTNAALNLYAVWKEIPLVTPDQVDASVAGIKVVANGTTYYFATLNSEIATWAGKVSGGAVITLLKDMTLSATVTFPAEWNAANTIVIDLAGYTVSNGAASAMFVMKGNGNLTVKNGTILNEKAASSICVGASDGAFADAASNFYAPVLTLDKVFMKSTGTGNYICPIYGKSVASTININNSAIYSANTGWRAAIEVQTDSVNAAGNALNVTGSIIYTKSQRVMRYENYRLVTLTFTDSAMVTQAAGGLTGGQIIGGRSFATVAKLNGVDIKADASQTTSSTVTGYTLVNGDWEGTMPDGTAITGAVGSVFGTAPTSIVLPFSVNFDANGGTGSVAAQFSATGAAIAVADGTGLSKVGYHFAGWNTKADGSGDAYAAGDDIAVGCVLFAQWAPNTYTIVFDANGGQNETPDQVITYDVETAIEGSRFSKLGFLFNGWNTEADGTGTAYTVGQMVKNLLTEGSMTLYAQWKEIPPFVPGADGPTHTCTRACATCGGCLDANCTDPVCAKKCTSAILPYADITAGAWYEDAVKYVTHAGLMNGTAADKFAPNAATSRAMVVTVLYRMEGAPAVYSANQFTDVADGLWYSDAIAWAAANGIVNGKSATIFDPNADITREQLAAILYRYANYKGVDVSVGEETNILSYVDAFDISEYAIPAFQWACGEGIINGKGNGVLDPIGNAKRCEFAKMLMAYIEG